MLPRLLLLTDATHAAGPLTFVVAGAIDRGVRAVVLREKHQPYARRRALAADLAALLAPVDGTLIVAGGPAGAGVPGGAAVPGGPVGAGPPRDPGWPAGGVHLAARDPFPGPRPALVGRSCHDAAEVARAAAEGCDYVTVSPIYPTASKPGYGPALGPSGLASLCGQVPVFALGGVLPEHVADCRRAGAYGVAVMGPAMRDPAIVAAYLAALAEVPA
ncbi:thiamine phosphate synthase [Luedemannella helvata]|uniref:Thiamine phosphate synthase/TenI domain-containing protein n=1 Tax=Luedemannella helvata TaxID=349315 RepID=A0ABN2KLJ7_9ACTN